jgi:hypothetical protein
MNDAALVCSVDLYQNVALNGGPENAGVVHMQGA